MINQKFVNYSCRVNNFAILKELEELKKKVAYKDRELELEKREVEREKQELEQLRSYLIAALAPLQGIDSLPRSLPAQSDNQIMRSV